MEPIFSGMDLEPRLLGLQTRRVWDYWREKAGTRPAPRWGEFSLMDIYQDAPITLVLDVDRRSGNLSYRYRYVGTKIVEYRWRLNRPDQTGQSFEDAEHQYDLTEIKAAYDRCAETGEPSMMQRDFVTLDASGRYERLILPLVTEGGEVDKLVCTIERLEERKRVVPGDPSAV